MKKYLYYAAAVPPKRDKLRPACPDECRGLFRDVISVLFLVAFLTSCGGGSGSSSGSSAPTNTINPSVTTNPATDITQTTAILNGTVNPNGITTTAYFQYSTPVLSTPVLPIGSGAISIAITDTAISLTPNTLYNFRVVGSNSAGTTLGNNLTFTTTALPPPSSTTNAATNVTANSAALNGTVNPNGLNVTSCYFDYGTSLSYGISATVVSFIGSGTNPISVTANVISLTSGTLYNFRVVWTNSSGTTCGNNLTFTTSASPTCITNVATNIASTSATLNGTVNPNGLNVTSCYFDYGTSVSYGSQQNVASLPGSGTSPISVTANVVSLLSSTQYNFRVVGTNSSGTNYGNNRTFTTGAPLGSAPTCTTYAADNITPISARLNGMVNPNGAATTAYFQYSTPVLSTPVLPIGSGAISIAITDTAISLTPNTLYNFRVVGTNSYGTTYGTNLTFTTTVTLKVHYIDVGQADCILIQIPNGKNVLIDAGNNADAAVILAYLNNLGVTRLDKVVGTHPHEDHIGSLDTVINTFDIGEVIMPAITATTQTYADVITATNNKGLTITEGKAWSTIDVGPEVVMQVFAPISDTYSDVNNYSVVIHLKFGETSFIFAGDAQTKSEGEMISQPPVRVKADVLKVGHHGSDTSTTPSFLAQVSPIYAVISVGAGNSYGHPKQVT